MRSELDAKAKELEKEMRLRRNLELNMKRELERVERQAIEKEKVGFFLFACSNILGTFH